MSFHQSSKFISVNVLTIHRRLRYLG